MWEENRVEQMKEEGRTEEYHVMGREQQFQLRTEIYSRFTFLSAVESFETRNTV